VVVLNGEPIRNYSSRGGRPKHSGRHRTKATKEGFKVIKAMNGKEALEKFYAHQPNLVLLDLMLPLVDGKEYLRR